MRSNQFFWIIMGAIGCGLIFLILNDSSGEAFSGNDDMGRVIYLGILGAVVGAGILGSGHRFGYIASNLALWMLAVLVLVAGYQYRYELQDFGSRVTAGLIPGSPMSVGGDDSAVMLEKVSNGHFEALITVNGVSVRAMVDTGATTTVLTFEDARAAGYVPDTLDFSITVSTANGRANAARVTADNITLGTISRSRVPMLVAEAGRLDQSLLGMNFINSLSGFDVRGDRMILRD